MSEKKVIHPRVGVVVPTRNAGNRWVDWLDALDGQIFKPTDVLVVDSNSTDDTPVLARRRGYRVEKIDPMKFNHGGTRRGAVEALGEVDIIVMLTQDAILSSPQSLGLLVRSFDDPNVGAAFGRQLPRPHAKAIEAHARLFNYPESSRVIDVRDIPNLGIKAIAISNSFAGYRRKSLQEVGSFPKDIIMGEDNYVGAKMLASGLRIAYCGDATVYHSHDYSFRDEFRRYFDIGVFHSREKWILQEFGSAEEEGGRFVRSQMVYLGRCAPWLIPVAFVHTIAKFVGYRLGRVENALPLGLKRRISMHPVYWRASDVAGDRHKPGS